MSAKIVIIGAGPAGEAAAKTAAKAGAQVTLIEKEEAGGLCLNKGCVPSKTLLEEVHRAMVGGTRLDWKKIQEFKGQIISTLRGQLEASFKSLKITTVRGAAQFKSHNSINVISSNATQTIAFDKAIIAGGTDILYPPPLNKFIGEILDSNRILDLERTPGTTMVIGGGAVGCEFACLLQSAGSNVTLIEMQENLMPGEDAGIVTALTNSFEVRGIRVKTGTTVKNLKKVRNTWEIELSSGEKMNVDELVACVGRIPHLDGFKLENAGIEFQKQKLTLNSFLQTTNPNVYAAGDVTLQTRLAHAASVQGEIAALNALGQKLTFDGSLVPRCLYTWPEVASVGQWKKESDKTARAFFKGSAKAMAAREAEGFVQIVSNPDTGKILGAQIIGPHATELIHIFSVALKAGMTVKDLGAVIFAHPTLAEAIKDAAKKSS